MTRFLQIAALASAVLSLSSLAAGQQYMATKEVASALADGKPWTGQRPSGDQVKITFNKEGSGRFEGPITKSITWAVQNDEFCIVFGIPMGTKCLRFQTAQNGFAAFEKGAPAFTFSR